MGFWEGRRVICTGGSGFLGSHLMDALRERGCDPFVPRSELYDLRSPMYADALFADARTHFWAGVPGGVREPAIDFLFHLAATCGGIGLNRRQPATMWYDNIMMGANLLETARRHGVGKFVAVGTVCSYPKHCPVPFSERSFWDGYPEDTNAPYGIAKKALLVGLEAYQRQHGLSYVYVTPTNLYGPRDHFDPEDSHVIPALIRKFLEAREAKNPIVPLWGTGDPTRDFLYVDDAAAAILKAASLLLGGPYNVGSGREVSIRELARMVGKATGYHGNIRFDASMPDGQPRRVLDSSKFVKLTGWEPEVDLEAGLARTVAWYVAERMRENVQAEIQGLPAEPGTPPSV